MGVGCHLVGLPGAVGDSKGVVLAVGRDLGAPGIATAAQAAAAMARPRLRRQCLAAAAAAQKHILDIFFEILGYLRFVMHV